MKVLNNQYIYTVGDLFVTKDNHNFNLKFF